MDDVSGFAKFIQEYGTETASTGVFLLVIAKTAPNLINKITDLGYNWASYKLLEQNKQKKKTPIKGNDDVS